VTNQRLVFRVHAVQRMAERAIATAEVRHALDTGEVVAHYPDDTPYPSRLVLGWIGTRPVHVVAAADTDDQLTVVITVYEPDPELWETGFKTRRRKP